MNAYKRDSLNDREDPRGDMQQVQLNYKTPQVTSSKASNLKSYNERQNNKSIMDYQQQGPSKTLNESQLNSNPLLGQSNYASRRAAFQSEYKDYIRKSLETSREHNMSKREAKYLEKI